MVIIVFISNLLTLISTQYEERCYFFVFPTWTKQVNK